MGPGKFTYHQLEQQVQELEKSKSELSTLLAKIEKSEKYLDSIFKSAPIGIGLVVNREIQKANKRLSEITGYREEELLGKSARLLYPDDQEFDFVGVEKYQQIKDLGTGAVETCWQRKDGNIIDVLLSSTPIDLHDYSKGVTFTALDITERKKMQEALEASELRFRSIVEGAPDPIFIQTEGKFAYLNPAGCKLIGLEAPDNIIGTTVIERFHPETRGVITERIRRLNIDRQSIVEPLEHRMLRMDGSEVWVETKGEPIVYQGKQGALVFVRDVHERKVIQQELEASELRFRTLAESAPAGIVVADPEGKVLFLNQHFTDLFGYTLADIPTVENWWPLAYPEKELQIRARLSWQISMEEAARSSDITTSGEFPVTCKNGTTKHIEFRKRSSGPLTFVLMTDVSTHKKAEAEVLATAEELRITLQSIGDAVVTTDTQGRVVRMNSVAEHLTGWQVEEAVGKPLDQVFVIRNARTGEPVSNPAETVLSFGQTVGLGNDTSLLAKDGKTYQIADSAAPIRDAQGQMRGVVLVFRDVTESYRLREAMQRERNILQLFVKFAPAAIAMFDRDMRYLSASDRFRADYHLNDVEILGRTHYEIFPEIPERWKEIHKRCLAGAVERCLEDPFPRTDGKIDWVRWEIRPWYEKADEIGGILLFSELITDFKQAQEALLESEKKIRFALDGTGMGAWDLNLKDRSMHRSFRHDEIFGYSSMLPEWTVENLLAHIHPEDLDRVGGMLTDSAVMSQDWASEFRIYRRDGAIRWLWLSGRHYLDSQDGTPHIAGIIQDITERKQNVERLEHINRVLDATRRINKLIVFEKNRHSLLQQVCNLLIDTRGYRSSWAALYNDEKLTAFLHSGNGSEFAALQNEMQSGIFPVCYRLVKEARSGVVSILNTKKTCPTCPMRSTYSDGAAMIGALRHNDRQYGLLVVALPAGLANDEEENALFAELTGDLGFALYSLEQEERRKQAEERYGLLFRTSTEGILIADIASKKFLIANPAICDFLGYSEQELLSLDVSAIHPAPDLPRIVDGFLKQARGEITLTADVPCLRRDGSIVYADVNATALVMDRRNCLVGFFRDITARKKAEAEQETLQKQLLQAQKMESVGRLAGGVAHDYNNMLNVIIGYAELALEDVDKDQPFYEELTEILKAAYRSTDITRQLLAFARKQTIAPVVLDLNDTISGMLKMLQRLIGENINLAWHPKANLWPVKMDPSQVDQILANLCVNARDAIVDTGRIIIETDNAILDEFYCAEHPESSVGEHVMLSIDDSGCGMDKETMERIFEPFFTTKGVGQGTGLGMATVYGIVKQNHGTINIYSEQDKGTSIKIYFPRHDREVQVVTAEKTVVIKGEGEALLLVEDDQAVRRMAKTMLERLGYVVIPAATPQEALVLAGEYHGKIGLLITDVVMPEMNGKELADRLLHQYPNLKVLFMSGYTANAIAHHGVLDENVNFIQKPFNQKDLAKKVRQAILRNG